MFVIASIFILIFLLALAVAPPMALLLLIALGVLFIIWAFFPNWWRLINEP